MEREREGETERDGETKGERERKARRLCWMSDGNHGLTRVFSLRLPFLSQRERENNLIRYSRAQLVPLTR